MRENRRRKESAALFTFCFEFDLYRVSQTATFENISKAAKLSSLEMQRRTEAGQFVWEGLFHVKVKYTACLKFQELPSAVV